MYAHQHHINTAVDDRGHHASAGAERRRGRREALNPGGDRSGSTRDTT
jgi:hypothetical protein